MTIRLLRYAERGDGVFGWLLANGFRCFTVEPPWLENLPMLSCVPAGSYRLVFELSPKFNRKLWELKDVPGRTEAKIHAANRATELEGCIGLGEMIAQDKHGWFVTNSRATVDLFHKAMGDVDESQIVITDAPGAGTMLAKPQSPTGPE